MTRNANPMRGEARFELDGQHFVLRPSFENLIAAEDEIGPLFALVERASQGAISMAEITSLIWHCIENDPRPSRDKVGQAVLEKGLIKATEPVRAILAQVLQGRV